MANGIKNSGGKISVKMGLVLVMVVLIEVIELDGIGGGWWGLDGLSDNLHWCPLELRLGGQSYFRGLL